ncbi:19549_t:CDS:2 [Dentiscutata erythropus]|uniref:19549_t:CDS:1 n=1 Tax=Dentiscutata erythropus TaxID=1348616 RepID=A0A9N9P1K5_9GLOM|nr:19549_t:CDS:2 [Dentiscutata erythropus]
MSSNNFNNSVFPEGLNSFSAWGFTAFEPLTYIYFNIAFVIIAYPLYRLIAGFLKWELNEKTPSKHYSDIIACIRYGFIVFVLGGYSYTFDWITILSFYVAMYSFGRIAEIPFAKQSLPTWRNWAIQMWIVIIVAILIILAFAAYHIYLGVIFTESGQLGHDGIFLAWYIGSLIIPVILILLGLLAVREQNDRFISKKWFKIVGIFKMKKKADVEAHSSNDNAENTENSEPVASGEETKNEPQPYSKSVDVHIHHWQIFYVLAFFTRFDDPISRVASGIVLGIYTQGMIA